MFDYAQYYLDLSDANRRDLEITGDESSAAGSSAMQVRLVPGIDVVKLAPSIFISRVLSI